MKKLFALLSTILISTSALADKVGEVKTSGIFIKDSIEIHSFQDPTLTGVACHVTYADKAFSMDNPTDSSISCRQVSKEVSGDYRSEQEDIFSKSKNLFFKTMRVDRFYDEKNHTLVYISYVRKTSGDNAAHSISSVPLYSAILK